MRVFPEDDGPNCVLLEVEGNAENSFAKIDHLPGADPGKAVELCNTIADFQYLSHMFMLYFCLEGFEAFVKRREERVTQCHRGEGRRGDGGAQRGNHGLRH